jgi:hypothetical protein
MTFLNKFNWVPTCQTVVNAVLILIAGLIIRVHPDYITLSVIAWASFIYGYLFLDGQWDELRYWGPMILSFIYNAFFHWYIL